jgi:DNA mismatch endonuclease (patch repair protein)
MADNLTREQRSWTMSRIRSRDTTPELTIRKLAHARGLRFRKHAKWLPGAPDLVFAGAKVVVFVDGDFWHGWRFAQWRDGLAPYWLDKIERNRQRDKRNVRTLRSTGWTVIRLWEHEIRADAAKCVDRVEVAVRARAAVAPIDGDTEATPPATIAR